VSFVGLLAVVVDNFTVYGETSKPKTPSVLTIEYRTDTASDAAVARPSLQVVNNSQQAVDLNQVTIRYYLAAPKGSQYSFNCVKAAVGCSNVTGSIGTPAAPATGADRYLQIGFTPGSGSLAPRQNSQNIDLQIYRLDHQNLSQDADRSFNVEDADYAPEKTITAYLNGVLVWGSEPGARGASTPGNVQAQTGSSGFLPGALSDSPSAAGTTTGGDATVVPPGTVFDAFHYSGPDDPALSQHGWSIRTGEGGPGIDDTWSTSGISFPAADAVSGQALQLRATTDGTKAGTSQAELEGTGMRFRNGTFAARVHFDDHPTSGNTGDPINEAFYLISPVNQGDYSELDNEYMPIGWGGVKGPILDTTTWFDAKTKDRATRRNTIDLTGWHTIVITATDGKVTYSVDGKTLFTTSGKYVPRTLMSANFNVWYGDLFVSGQRAWDMQVNWFFASDKAMSPGDIDKSVADLYARGSSYVNTMPTS
jgi:hypothetical protein